MPRAGIALGSNLGDRLQNLRTAVAALRALSTPGELFLEAPARTTEPENCPPGSPDFLNTVVELDFAGTAFGLLEKTRAIEAAHGRDRGPERNAPRTLDLDLLYFGNEILSTPDLELPHPRIAGRRFVLEPLAGIRPDLRLPNHQKTISEMLAELDENRPTTPFHPTNQAVRRR